MVYWQTHLASKVSSSAQMLLLCCFTTSVSTTLMLLDMRSEHGHTLFAFTRIQNYICAVRSLFFNKGYCS